MKSIYVLVYSALVVPVFVAGGPVAKNSDVAGGMTLRPYTSNSSLQIFTEALSSFYL